MKKNVFRFYLLICACAALFCMNAFAGQSATTKSMSAVGYWQTIDDKTHHARSVIQVWKKGNAYFGKIDFIYPVDGQKKTDRCAECKGKFHNHPMLGLTIMKDFQKIRDGYYAKGTIMDPRSGKVYKCHMAVKDGGRHLLVHGYIGIPLFGRTQTWNRVANPNHSRA